MATHETISEKGSVEDERLSDAAGAERRRKRGLMGRQGAGRSNGENAGSEVLIVLVYITDELIDRMGCRQEHKERGAS